MFQLKVTPVLKVHYKNVSHFCPFGDSGALSREQTTPQAPETAQRGHMQLGFDTYALRAALPRVKVFGRGGARYDAGVAGRDRVANIAAVGVVGAVLGKGAPLTTW
jgi:hypothetical protein